LAAKLKAAAAGRPDDEALLLQPNGKPFNEDVSGTYRRAWVEIAKAAGVRDATPYLFRHSSIARQLLRGVPTRVCADLHDTSVVQIEAHYGKHLTEHADDIARAALLSHDEPRPADDVVVPIGGR
jgi:integrase